MTNQVQVFVRKKCTGLLSTLIFELNQMISDKIIDGSVGFERSYLSILLENLGKRWKL